MKNAKNRKSLLSVLTVISGSFVILFYGINLAKNLVLRSGLTELLIAAAVIAAASLAIAFREKAWKWLRVLLCAGMCFYMVSFSAFLVYIGWCGAVKPTLPADSDAVILVFGCRTYGMNPGKTLARRLEGAITLLEGSPDTVCVVSGGQGSNEEYPEAEVMARYLEARGIAPERILLESESANTVENLRYSAALLREKGLDGRPVIGVSNSFHIPRIRMLAAREGMTLQGYGTDSADPFSYLSDAVREYMAWAKALLLA